MGVMIIAYGTYQKLMALILRVQIRLFSPPSARTVRYFIGMSREGCGQYGANEAWR